ncbi:hypothetical protein LMG1860_00433 [Achromobacter denitrificans]|nr:hypothetical protein LMG1860_00433 [Achromobacter denitrificans]
MTDQNNAAQATQEAERIAAADEYFKARSWIMDTNDNRRIFEAGFDRAYALLSKLRAPVAEIHVGVSATGRDATICIMQPHADGSITTIYSATHPLGDSMGRAALASAPVADESPMAKMAEALREKARQEQQAYQDRRNQATEWGPMPEGTEADSPTSSAPVAHVAGDEVSRHLEWAKDRSAWEMPVGTPVYYSVLASAPVAKKRSLDGDQLRAIWVESGEPGNFTGDFIPMARRIEAALSASRASALVTEPEDTREDFDIWCKNHGYVSAGSINMLWSAWCEALKQAGSGHKAAPMDVSPGHSAPVAGEAQPKPDTSEADASPIVPGGPYTDPEDLIATLDAAPQASAAPAAFPKDGVRSGRSGPDGVFIPASQASADAFPPIDPVQAHVAHCHGCETCDGWHDMLGSQRQASEAVRNAGIAASVDQLVTAAKGMTKLYPHVWDRTDGGLVVFPENVARFDAAFDALRIAVGEAVDDDGTAALSAQPGAQKTGGGDAE